MSEAENVQTVGEIAVIGMSCRFPGAKNLKAFWKNLRQGVESIRFFSDQELTEIPQQLIQESRFVKAFGALQGTDLFDAEFFGLSPREAEITDPQQRLFLECGWEALESAGCNPETHGESTGVFAGAGSSTYVQHLLGNPALADAAGGLQLAIGNEKDHLAPRLSYLLNLRGPSVPIQTACSTSLVAVHMACQSLNHFECDLALAGGSTVSAIAQGYLYQESGILSPDGHCRAFDARANGTAPGNGVGLVVLKRLEEAIADRDRIYAVIKGSAINNDGAAKVGYTAPSVEGQRRVVREALAVSGVQPVHIGMIEAHGTGTALGDPIEFEALCQAFGEGLNGQHCALGTVKTNIGHCDAAAGVAGLIKAILCLEHRQLVPSLHFESPNPGIQLSGSPFYVNTECKPWPDGPRLAGVSSFGIGGTNAHLILREPPPAPVSGPSRQQQIVTLSARTPSALQAASAKLSEFLNEHSDVNLADLAYTLTLGRKAFPFRKAFVSSTARSARIPAGSASETRRAGAPGGHHSVVFLFPGQGGDHADLGRELYDQEGTFRQQVDECCRLLRPALGLNLAELMFGAKNPPPELKWPRHWQPALFVAEYALAKLWMSWGVQPEAMMGHSIGEYVAATLSGVFSLPDALSLVAARGAATEQIPKGAMLAVPLAEEEIQPCLTDEICLAAVNGPQLCVLSGPTQTIEGLEATLRAQGVEPIRLASTHAFHSRMMAPLEQILIQAAAAIERHPPLIPFISNQRGDWMSDQEAQDPAYWARHLLNPVRFHQGLQELEKDPARILLEVGPGATLSRLASRRALALPAAASLDPDRESSQQSVLAALGALWSAGAAVDWEAFYQGQQRCRIPLPTYPFERKSYWIKAQQQPQLLPDPLSVRLQPSQWLYHPVWKQAPFTRPLRLQERLEEGGCWLLLADSGNVTDCLADRLVDLGQRVLRAYTGQEFAHGDGNFTLRPGQQEDFQALAESLEAEGHQPSVLLHAWCLGDSETGSDALKANLNRGFQSLIQLTQSLSGSQTDRPIQLGVLTNGSQQIVGQESFFPERASMLGTLQVIPKEFPAISCKFMDIELPSNGASAPLLDQIIGEFAWPAAEPLSAYRGGRRWVLGYEPLPRQEDESPMPLRPNGVYLITHAFQETGLALAERLADRCRARLVLADRTFFPAPAEWPQWLQEQGLEDPISRKIRRLQPFGDRIEVACADLSSRKQLQGLLERASRRWAPISGLFHLDPPAETGLIQGKSAGRLAERLSQRMEVPLLLSQLCSQADFLAFFAQNEAEAGGLGQVEQAAAYAFLDHLAQGLSIRTSQRVVCIDWGTRQWEERADSAAAVVSAIDRQLQEKRRLFGMTQQECLDTLERALSLSLPRLIVSTRDYPALLAQQDQFTTDYFQQQLAQPRQAEALHARPDLPTAYSEPESQIERLVAETWQSYFGFDRIGLNDNFFELGGHSLLAVQLLSQLNNTFSARLTLQDLFDHPTVAELSSLVAQSQLDAEEAEDLGNLLEEIEGLSEEEVRAALEVE